MSTKNPFVSLYFKLIRYRTSKIFKFVSLLLVIYLWIKLRRIYLHIIGKIRNYPPGVYIGVPILGHYLWNATHGDYDQTIYNSFIGKFGPLVTTVHGTTYTIYVNDIDIMRDAGYKNIISRSGATLWNDHINDFFFGDGNKWFHRRKIFATSILFQMTTANLRKLIANILNQKMFPKVDKYNNKIYETLKLDMQYIIFCLIFALIFDRKYFKERLPLETDQIFIDYITQIRRETDALMYAIMNTQIFGINVGNYLNHNVFKNMDSAYQLDIVGDKIIKDYENYKSNYKSSNTDDVSYIDMLLNDKSIKRVEIIRDVILLFRAGDTSSSTIEQALYYLIKHQKMQNDIFDELNMIKQKSKNNDQIDGGFSPLDYMNELHLLKAFVYEVLRTIMHAPHSYPRYTIDDNVKINGYNIPKGSCVFGNHFHINHSPKYWEKPNEFYLGHFLDENNKFKKNKHMMTFGTGRRGCPGYTVTVKLLLAMFGHMILRYEFVTNPENKADFDGPNLPFAWMTVSEEQMPIIVKMRAK